MRWAAAVVALLLVAAPSARAADPYGQGAAPSGNAARPPLPRPDKDADNTGQNVRDRNEGAVTPTQQSNSKQDLEITQHIRRSVVNNDQLSTNAQNVKIVTQDGIVTLRGPVKNAQERQSVVTAAWSAPGVKDVKDQLEIERQK